MPNINMTPDEQAGACRAANNWSATHLTADCRSQPECEAIT